MTRVDFRMILFYANPDRIGYLCYNSADLSGFLQICVTSNMFREYLRVGVTVKGSSSGIPKPEEEPR